MCVVVVLSVIVSVCMRKSVDGPLCYLIQVLPVPLAIAISIRPFSFSSFGVPPSDDVLHSYLSLLNLARRIPRSKVTNKENKK